MVLIQGSIIFGGKATNSHKEKNIIIIRGAKGKKDRISILSEYNAELVNFYLQHLFCM